jgi:hypothetical protein
MDVRGIKGLMGRLVATILPLAVLAAEPEASPDQELDEILVEGQKPERNPEKYVEWLTRLVGRYVVDGSVDLHGAAGSEPRDVRGSGECIGFFPIRAVQCQLNLRWPEIRGPNGESLQGGISHLDPALILFGYDHDRIGIRHMLVGNDGIAEEAKGYLFLGRTLVSRNKCVNVPGNCQRVVRITADTDMKEVQVAIDLEVEYRTAASLRFVMHRTQEAK